MRRTTIGRRGFIQSLAGCSAAKAIGAGTSIANAEQERPAANRRPATLPARGEFVVRNGYILTMDPIVGDIPAGDVHVRDGQIIAVGKALTAPGAATIDGRHMIVLPGLIDTHWHMWTTYLRCMAGDTREDGYFPVTTLYGQAMQPADMYHSTRLAAAEAIFSGTTTVNNECHNVRSYDHAVADIRAVEESGLRARWSFGAYRGMPAGRPKDMASFRKLHEEWANHSNGGLITLGLTAGGAGTVADPLPPESMEIVRREFDLARQLGVPISTHLSARENTPPGWVEASYRAGFLGRDVLLIHVLSASAAEMKMIAEAGSAVSASPGSELRIGYGLTKACAMMDAGVNVSVSVDTAPLTGSCHMFGILKLLRNAENAKAFDEFKLSARRAIELGTINGARALGIDKVVGSLTPGKRADLIMVSTTALNMGVFTDPTHMIVEATEPANVDTVVVDGRILKRGGRMMACVPEQIIAGASASRLAVARRASRVAQANGPVAASSNDQDRVPSLSFQLP
jgi:cytosine/adenosine deaminase-related metal-dependent hydrolase